VTDLAARSCTSCNSDTPTIGSAESGSYLLQLPDWQLVDGKLTRDVKLRDFRGALDRLNAIAELAESEGHHPDLGIKSWNILTMSLWTHSAGGLTENDFIMAAKIDALLDPP
jgi:4a-hydroxytetrahydrobiopterin dehydratase